MCTWVNAIENAREAAAPSRYFLASASGRGAIVGAAGREGHPHDAARREPHAIAQRGDRVEDGAGGARERAPVEREGVRGGPAAPDEARAVGLPLDRAAEAPLDAEHVERPERRLVRPARPTAEQQAGALRVEFRFDEQLAERRVGEVVLGPRQHDLRVAGDLDLARPRAPVGDRQPADLDVVLGRDRHLQLRLEVAGARAERDLVEVERRLEACRARGRSAGRSATRPGPTTDRGGRCTARRRRTSDRRAAA